MHEQRRHGVIAEFSDLAGKTHAPRQCSRGLPATSMTLKGADRMFGHEAPDADNRIDQRGLVGKTRLGRGRARRSREIHTLASRRLAATDAQTLGPEYQSSMAAQAWPL